MNEPTHSQSLSHARPRPEHGADPDDAEPRRAAADRCPSDEGHQLRSPECLGDREPRPGLGGAEPVVPTVAVFTALNS